ncbi:MAG: prolipoprotein diacylglyceryl transferase [Clostridia bacterium]
MNIIQFPELGLNFTIDPVAFTVAGYSVAWYGIIIAVGFFLAVNYSLLSCFKMNINSDHLFDAIVVGLIFGIIGARLYYVVFYPGDTYINDPMLIFNLHSGGLGIYGGIIGGLLGGCLVAKFRKIKISSCLDVASLGFLIGQGVGRWGNFVNAEAYGSDTNLPWGMLTNTSWLETTSMVHPCFFYESMLCFIGFILLHIFTRKYRKYDGQTFLLYLVWYGVIRFIIEGLRTDSLMVGPLKISQVVAVITVAVASYLLYRNKKKNLMSLIGCGDKEAMELNNVVFGSAVPHKKYKDSLDTQSTIFEGEDLHIDSTEKEKQSKFKKKSKQKQVEETTTKEGIDGENN